VYSLVDDRGEVNGHQAGAAGNELEKKETDKGKNHENEKK